MILFVFRNVLKMMWFLEMILFVFRNVLKMLWFLEMILFFLKMISFIFEYDLICCCTLASEYPHFKSSPINFTLVFSS